MDAAGTGTMKSGGGGILRRHSADSRQLPTADSEDATTTNPGGSKDVSTFFTCTGNFSRYGRFPNITLSITNFSSIDVGLSPMSG